MFLGSYLRGDLARTVHHANQITDEDFPLGLVARALATPPPATAIAPADSIERLEGLNPAMGDDPRCELDKFFPVDCAGRPACARSGQSGLPRPISPAANGI